MPVTGGLGTCCDKKIRTTPRQQHVTALDHAHSMVCRTHLAALAVRARRCAASPEFCDASRRARALGLHFGLSEVAHNSRQSPIARPCILASCANMMALLSRVGRAHTCMRRWSSKRYEVCARVHRTLGWRDPLRFMGSGRSTQELQATAQYCFLENRSSPLPCQSTMPSAPFARLPCTCCTQSNCPKLLSGRRHGATAGQRGAQHFC